MSDDILALVAPIAAYWIYSLFFHILDSIDSPLLDRYRIHDSAEIKARNLVTRTSCVLWVAFQQVIQTAMGWYWIDEDAGLPGVLTDISSIRNATTFCARLLLGETTAARFLHAYGPQSVWFIYWWGIPLTQLVFAM